MGHFIRLIVVSLACSGVLLLTACSSNGGEYRTVHYSVYSGYDYPYYGGGGYYYDDDHHHHDDDHHDRPDRPIRPDRPDRPDGTTFRPATRPGLSGGGMGRPAMSRGGGFGGGGRGGGGRGGGRGR